ncbi:PepSY domain-containing protein [Gilvimarinus japonicus]|jgi:uncharacterized membrane protein YkoI|uniref:PepSY domain-containing protein n=1 Tax=Gilvimarinus japonicus TaxID=1796469 RepID=A0ABV7HZK8_9GAMM
MIRLICIIAGLLLATSMAVAAPGAPTLAGHLANPVAAGSAQCAISAAKAGQIASKLYGGKVIDVKQVSVQGRAAFRVKLLQSNGRIHSVLIDAGNGRPLQ